MTQHGEIVQESHLEVRRRNVLHRSTLETRHCKNCGPLEVYGIVSLVIAKIQCPKCGAPWSLSEALDGGSKSD